MILADSPVLKINLLVSERFCLRCTRQKSQFLRKKGICKGPLARWVLPSVVEKGKQLLKGPPNPIHALWMADTVTCSSLQFGNRLIPWGNFSAEVELLRAD